MRHGHSPAAPEAKVAKDALRPLSERGRRDAARMAQELVSRGGKPALLLHSPLLRARQTAELVARELGDGVRAEEFQALDNTLAPDELLERLLGRAGRAADVLAIGHNPQLAELAALIGRQLIEIRPAGMVALELEPARRLLWWSNVDELD